uniref:Uncharacterized protein n=1 Tax=Polysiphonia sertularioides TaxID=945028 RepID=A0A1Z1M8U4_9FLOR|nr:hypothetical protein [Polysiphonia sertularioides]ARW62517.1 hypothetical protein [Polysiphonia sertularioides]
MYLINETINKTFAIIIIKLQFTVDCEFLLFYPFIIIYTLSF